MEPVGLQKEVRASQYSLPIGPPRSLYDILDRRGCLLHRVTPLLRLRVRSFVSHVRQAARPETIALNQGPIKAEPLPPSTTFLCSQANLSKTDHPKKDDLSMLAINGHDSLISRLLGVSILTYPRPLGLTSEGPL